MKTKKGFVFCLALLFLGSAVAFSQSVIASQGSYIINSYKINGVEYKHDNSHISWAVYTDGRIEYVFNRNDGGTPARHYLTNEKATGGNSATYDASFIGRDGGRGFGTARVTNTGYGRGGITYEYTINGRNDVMTYVLLPYDSNAR